ncbi:hypothetical protein D6D17_10718 [Aureobasidium pullulans]|nr:hypothetical protein D6D17_10718 [Aureobasidium pullulans]
MSYTTIDFANYPLAPLLVVLRDYILAYYALEFYKIFFSLVPFNGSLCVLNLPLGYIATVYTNAKGRPIYTYYGHPRRG